MTSVHPAPGERYGKRVTQPSPDVQISMTSSAMTLPEAHRTEHHHPHQRKSVLSPDSHVSHPSAAPSIEDSSRLTYQLSKELALLHGLTLGLGGEADSERLREEVRLSRLRACTLALQNHPCLLPLLRSRASLKQEEVGEVERVYRLYSGCLEYLLHLLQSVRFLLLTFDIHSEACLLIQTGISETVGIVHRSSFAASEGPHPHTAPPPHEEHDKLVGDMEAMQDLLYTVTSACDIQPWDVGEEASDLPPPQPHNASVAKFHLRSPSRHVTFNLGPPRRHRVAVTVALVVTLVVIVAVAVTVALLTTS